MGPVSELVERERRPRPDRTPTPTRPRPGVAGFVQRCIGNGRPGCDCPDDGLRVQPAPAVNPPGDRYEQEAEDLADRIMAAAGSVAAAEPARVSRLAAGPAPAAAGIDGPLDQSGGRPLSLATRSSMESGFGVDFGAVRVHDDADAEALAGRLQARAFTYGTHIWLGAGEEETDRGLMAHELTHVLQQGGAASAVQRQPACNTSTAPRNVDVFLVSLPGATRDPYGDVTQANRVWAQCAINLNVAGGENWPTTLLDQTAPTGVLNEYTTVTSPTAEETTLLAYQPGGAAIHVYFVPKMSAGSRGEAFGPVWNAKTPDAVIVADNAVVDTFAHELGHLLVGKAPGHDANGHHPNADNLMAAGDLPRNVGVDKLECPQCR